MIDIFRRVFKSQKLSPSLPPDLSLSSILDKTLAGFLARDMDLESQTDIKEADLRFYHSIFQSSERNKYLELTEKLLEWIRKGEDIEGKINDLSLSIDTKNLMLVVLNKYRKELEELLNPAKKTSFNDDSSFKDPHYQKWKIYRDVIYACTNKQFLLVSRKEVDSYKTGELICEGKIQDRYDIPKCRDMVQRSLEQLNICKHSITNWLLAVSEAITNTIKHASDGKLEVYKNTDDSISVIVEDNGPGFDLDDLPNTTLLAGYSTKQSLGQGFILMRKMTERLLLYTSPKGSSIILIFRCDQ